MTPRRTCSLSTFVIAVGGVAMLAYYVGAVRGMVEVLEILLRWIRV